MLNVSGRFSAVLMAVWAAVKWVCYDVWLPPEEEESDGLSRPYETRSKRRSHARRSGSDDLHTTTTTITTTTVTDEDDFSDTDVTDLVGAAPVAKASHSAESFTTESHESETYGTESYKSGLYGRRSYGSRLHARESDESWLWRMVKTVVVTTTSVLLLPVTAAKGTT